MFAHMLIPTDGSDMSTRASHGAIKLAKALKSRITVVLVSPSFSRLANEGYTLPVLDVDRADWEHGVNGRATNILDAAAADAAKAGVPCETLHVFGDEPHAAIINAAKDDGCDLIVMGSHGWGGFKQMVLGSETTRVLSQSTIPVLVYR